MQDEVNEKVVALSIKTSKLTAEVLQKAMKAVLAKGKQQLSKAPHGKITMRQLMKPGEKVTNIEITDANIKSFDPSRQLRHHAFPRRQGENDPQRNIGNLGERND